MKTFKYQILILITLQLAAFKSFAINISWVDSATNKDCVVRIPSTINLNLPTSDTYEIGFFIYMTDRYSCVGKAVAVPGEELFIVLGYNTGAGGVYGYRSGDRFISFIRNINNPSIQYAVEFNYENGNNKCQQGQTSVVSGIAVSLWNWPSNTINSFCNYEDSFDIKIPYGLVLQNLNIPLPTSFYRDNGDNSYTIFLKDITPGKYSFSFTPYVSEIKDSIFEFEVKKFPVDVLNQQYLLCDRDIITIKENDVANNVTRTLINSSNSFIINKPGSYQYSIKETTSGCATTDIVNVIKDTSCPPRSSEDNILINPSQNDHLVFFENEVVEVYDINLKKVSTISSPIIWSGLDSNGKPLPMGLYIVIHADKKVQYVTVVY